MGLVEVNSRKTSFDLFRDSVRSLSKHEKYELVLNENIKSNLKVATRNSTPEQLLSSPLLSDELLPYAELIDDELSSSPSGLELFDKCNEDNFVEFCDLLRIRQQSF